MDEVTTEILDDLASARPTFGAMARRFWPTIILDQYGEPMLKEVTRQHYGAGGRSFKGRSEYVGPYNPVRVSMTQLKLMRMNPQLYLGLLARKAPVLSAFEQVTYHCEIPEQSAFVDAALAPILRDFIRSGQNCLDFGFAPHEKVWEQRDVRYVVNEQYRMMKGATVYKQLKDLDPAKTKLLIYEDSGEFAGLIHNNDPKQIVDPEGCWIVTHEKEFGSLYGQSILARAYEPWYWASIIYLFTNRYYERMATPPIVGYAPTGRRESTSSGGKTSLQIMADACVTLIGEGVLTLPSQFDDKGNKLWTIEYLKDDQRGEMFISYLQALEELKLIAIGVPPRVVTQYGSVGTFAMARSHTDTFITCLTSDMAEILTHTNRYLIPQLVEYNFGSGAPPVTMETVIKLSDRKELIIQLLSEIIAAEARSGTLTASSMVDITNALRQLGVPVRSPDDERKDVVAPESTPQAKDLEKIAASQWQEWQAIVDNCLALGTDPIHMALPSSDRFQKSVYEMLKTVVGPGKKTSSAAKEVAKLRRESMLKYAQDRIGLN